MDGLDRIQQYLHRHRVDYCVRHHPLAFTAQDVAATEHLSGALMAKVVMVMADERLAMLVLPASRRVDEQRAAEVLGADQVRLASEDEFASAFQDCNVGAMPPFGNLYGIPVCVDSALTEDETITFQAGTHTCTISIKYADYESLVGPTVADLAVHQLSHRA